MTAKNILVAESRIGFRKQICEQLRSSGCETVAEASNLGEALDKLKLGADLTVVDLSLLDLDGDAVSDLFGRCRKSIVIAAAPDAARVEEALEAGADDFLLRPYGKNDLVSLVEKVTEDLDKG